MGETRAKPVLSERRMEEPVTWQGDAGSNARWLHGLLAITVLVLSGCEVNRPEGPGERGEDSEPVPMVNRCTDLSDDHRFVERSHEVSGRDGPVPYTVYTGLMPLREHDTGETLAHMGYVAYTREGDFEDPRPLTFVWNGGPGAASSILHLTGVGPKIVEMSDRPDGSRPRDPELTANEETWLEFTDLVFVDPVGTGYSRAARPDHLEIFWSDQGDADSVAEFIRLYLVHYDAWDAPVFVAGQSFGAQRAARLTDVLPERGLPLAGTILISSPFRSSDSELRGAATLPSYAATAFAHGRLPADLQRDLESAVREAERFALGTYQPALTRLDELSKEERREVARGLARLTGVEPSTLEENDLLVDTPFYVEQLLADEGRVVGRYDGRLSGPMPPDDGPYDPRADPSLQSHFSPGLVSRYFRDELGFGCDLVYAGPFGGFWPRVPEFRGDWMTLRWTRTAETATESTDTLIGRALDREPSLRILVVMGIHDLVTPYFVAETAIRALELEPEQEARIDVRSYSGGHSPYHDRPTRMQLRDDVAAFVAATLGGGLHGPEEP